MLQLKKAVHTRWLSHDQAITVLRRTLSSVMEREVAENDEAVARGLLREIKTYNFIATVYLLSDVHPVLTQLSLVFQTADVDLSVIKPQVSATIASLKSLRNHQGPHMQELDKTLGKLSSDFGIAVTERLKQNFQSNVRNKYIDLLVQNLEDRFQDLSILNSLITLFDPKTTDINQHSPFTIFELHRNKDIEILSTYFKTTIVKKNLKFEWLGFKYILVSEFKLMSTTQVMQTMCENSSLVELYPTISKLACIALTIPVSTADVERGFSTMNRIKTEPRNRLNTETLDR